MHLLQKRFISTLEGAGSEPTTSFLELLIAESTIKPPIKVVASEKYRPQRPTDECSAGAWLIWIIWMDVIVSESRRRVIVPPFPRVA